MTNPGEHNETISPEQLRRVGEALYGEQWQTQLSRALNVESRTVRRWVSGAATINPNVIPDLREIVADQIETLEKLTARIAKLKTADAELAKLDRTTGPR